MTKPKYEIKPHERQLVDLAVSHAKQSTHEEIHSALEFNIRKIAFALSQKGVKELGPKFEKIMRILLDKFSFTELDLARKKQVLAWLTKRIFDLGRIPTEAELLEHRIVRINKEKVTRERIIKNKDKLQHALDQKIDKIMVESGIYKISSRQAVGHYSRLVKPLPRTRNELLERIPRLVEEDIKAGKADRLLRSESIVVFRKWQNPEVRKRVVRILGEILGLEPVELNGFYFELFGVRAILQFYNSSPSKAVTEAYGLKPWEASKVSSNFFRDSQKQVEAIRWLMQKTGKSLDLLIQDDLLNNGLSGLLRGYKNNLTNLKNKLRPHLM